MKRFLRKLFTFSIVAVVALPISVAAHPGHNHDETTIKTTESTRSTAQDIQRKVEAQKQLSSQKAETIQTERKQRLNDAKRTVCDNNKLRINTIMGNMNDRRQKAYDQVTKVYENIKNFTVDKQLDIDGYAGLTTSIDTAQAAALSAMKSQQDAPKLDCSGEQPRADVSTFKTKRQSSIDAMRTYRDAVRDLVKTVKSSVQSAREVQS